MAMLHYWVESSLTMRIYTRWQGGKCVGVYTCG